MPNPGIPSYVKRKLLLARVTFTGPTSGAYVFEAPEGYRVVSGGHAIEIGADDSQVVVYSSLPGRPSDDANGQVKTWTFQYYSLRSTTVDISFRVIVEKSDVEDEEVLLTPQ